MRGWVIMLTKAVTLPSHHNHCRLVFSTLRVTSWQERKWQMKSFFQMNSIVPWLCIAHPPYVFLFLKVSLSLWAIVKTDDFQCFMAANLLWALKCWKSRGTKLLSYVMFLLRILNRGKKRQTYKQIHGITMFHYERPRREGESSSWHRPTGAEAFGGPNAFKESTTTLNK